MVTIFTNCCKVETFSILPTVCMVVDIEYRYTDVQILLNGWLL